MCLYIHMRLTLDLCESDLGGMGPRPYEYVW